MAYIAAIQLLIFTPWLAARFTGFEQAVIIFVAMILYGFLINYGANKR